MTDSVKLDLLLSEMQELKGDVHTLKEDTQTLKEDVHLLKEDTRTLKEDVHLLKEDTQTLKEDVCTLKEDVCTLKEDVFTLKEDVCTLKEDVKNLELKTDAIENKTRHTNLILENEIRVNIQRVAEGHLDLSRNLHDAMRPSNELETLSIRVGMLESEMKEVKAKLA